MLRDTIARFDKYDWAVSLLGLGAAVALVHSGLTNPETDLLATGIFAAILVGGIAYSVRSEIQREYDDTCPVCGEAIVVDSATDGRDHAIEVRVAESPDRWALPGIRARNRETETVCSGTCAENWLAEYERFQAVAGRADTGASAEVSD